MCYVEHADHTKGPYVQILAKMMHPILDMLRSARFVSHSSTLGCNQISITAWPCHIHIYQHLVQCSSSNIGYYCSKYSKRTAGMGASNAYSLIWALKLSRWAPAVQGLMLPFSLYFPWWRLSNRSMNVILRLPTLSLASLAERSNVG